ncbi:MAG: type II secretion system F family protein [Myxococcota bacterium]|jgi:tight adherence protein B|nr:type II secretion system F family protein [Myxococcota bacterium]
MAPWFILAASLTCFFVLMTGYLLWRRRKLRLEHLVRERLAIERSHPGAGAGTLMQEDRRRIAVIDRLLQETGTQQRLQDLLDQAGEPTSPGSFVLRSLLWGLGPALVLGTLTLSPGVALLCCLGGLLPLVLLLQRRGKRMQKIDAQLPVALEIMTISLRAGHSLAQTIELSANELQAPLGDELRRAAEEHRLGRSLEEVLVSMSRRLPGCRALRTFVVAVLVLQQTGGNLIEIIEKIIETLRMQTQYERKLGAMTAEGKSSARMLSGLPLAFIALAYLADPGYIGMLFTDPIGQKLLIVSVTLWCVGILWTRKLISPAS